MTNSRHPSSQVLLPQFVAMEVLEDRLLLANVAPTFATSLFDSYWMPEKVDSGGNYVLNGSGQTIFTSRTIGIDGADANGDALTITAVSDNPAITTLVPTGNRYAKLHFVASDGTTVIGDVVIQLLEDRAAAATSRFITLATKHINADGSIASTGSPFYTNVLVHRVIPGFMIQTGDAANGDGTGGSPLGSFNDPNPWPDLSFAGAGVVAMANSGDNTNDSQFFITDAPTAWLNDGYFIFGQVISGQNIVEQIINVSRDTSNDRPYNPPVLQNVQIVNGPQDGTVTIHAADGFAGSATVTVTLNDGHGGVTQKVLTIRPLADLGDRPTITADTVQTMVSGTTNVIAPVIADDRDMPIACTVTSSNSLVTASIDPATHQITLTAPATFSGIVNIRVTAVEAGWADLTPSTKDLFVYAHGTPEAPLLAREVSSYLGTQKYAMAAEAYGDRVFLANDAKGIAEFNISDPTHPSQTAQTTATLSGARDLKVVGTTLFVADTYGGFKAFDISGTATIPQIGAISTAGAAVCFVVSGNTAWVADYTGGVTAIDITNPAAMVKIGSYKKIGAVTTQYVGGVAISGNRLYLGDMAGGVVILDITDRTNPVLLGSFSAGVSVFGIAVAGTTLYTTDTNGALRIWNVANPALPVLSGAISIPGAWQVKVSGTLALVSGSTGAYFVDVRDPKKLRLEYTYSSPNGSGIIGISGPNVILPMGYYGFSILRAVRTIVNTSATLPIINQYNTFSISGGILQVYSQSVGFGTTEEIVILNGSAKGTFSLTTPVGTVTTIGDVVVNGSLKSFSAPAATLIGDFHVTGSLESLTLAGAEGGHSLDIDQVAAGRNPAALLTASLGVVSDLDVTVNEPIKSFTVATWGDDLLAPDAITAPSIAALTSRGAFVPDLTLSGAGNPRQTLGNTSIAGALLGSTWTVTGPVGNLTVGGTVGEPSHPWTLTGAASLGNTSLAEVANADISVTGAIGTLSALLWADGSVHARTLKSLNIPGSSAADITLTGTGTTTPTTGNLTVGGTLTGTWDIAGKVGTVSAKGTVGALGTPWQLLNVTGTSAFTLGTVVNADVSINGSTAAVTTGAWAAGAFHADTVSSFKTNGDFAADFTLDGPALPTKTTAGSITVTGNLSGGNWAVTGKVSTLSIAHFQTNLALPAANVTTLTSLDPLTTVLVGGLKDHVRATNGLNTYDITFNTLTKWPTATVNA